MSGSNSHINFSSKQQTKAAAFKKLFTSLRISCKEHKTNEYTYCGRLPCQSPGTFVNHKKKKKRKLIDSPPGVCRRCRGKHEKSYLANIKEWTGFQMEVYLEVIKTSLRHCCLIVSPRRLARGGGRRWLLAPSLSELFNGVTMVIFICSVFSVLGSLRKISDVWYRIFESFINTCYSLFVIWSRIKF